MKSNKNNNNNTTLNKNLMFVKLMMYYRGIETN